MSVRFDKASCCVVCAAALAPAGLQQAADPYPTCFAVACRMVVSRRAEMGEAGFRYYLQLQSRHTQERQAQNLASAERRRREALENARGWQNLLASLPPGADEPVRLLLPSGPRRSRQSGAQRRGRYQAHLERIVAAARALDPIPVDEVQTLAEQEVPAPTLPSAMPGALCALCAGGCCTLGGEHAYLTAETMRPLMDRDAALTNQSIVAAYLDRLPAKSQDGSCINHTAAGCTLPREMRSATCNRYACEALAALQQAQRMQQGSSVTVIVVQRQRDHWRRLDKDKENPVIAGTVLTEQEQRRVSPRQLGLAARPLSSTDAASGIG